MQSDTVRESGIIINSSPLIKQINNQAKDARTEYAVYAVKIKNEVILLNLSQANRIIEEALPKPRFSFLGLRRQIMREKEDWRL